MRYLTVRKAVVWLGAAVLIAVPRVHAQLVTCGGVNQDPCTFADLATTVQKIFRFMTFNLAVPVAAVVIVWGGVTMAISAGNVNKFAKGRKIITAAAIGLLIVFGAYLIVQTVTSFVGISK